jgi:serine/threonine protein kinase
MNGEHASWDFEEGTPICEQRRVLAALGGGSSYEVYLAWDERMFALVIAKMLRPHLVSDPHALRDLRREAEALGRLAHPGLVRSFGSVLDGPYPHLVLEHVEGPSMRRLVKRHGAMALEQLLPLALELVAVLQYLAGAGYVHLDVKPDNVVMGVPPRLIDLSIARSLDSASRLRDAIGTDGYMAPEQCDPATWPGRIGPHTDVFGLGATLYHAASGVPPFPRGEGARESKDLRVRFPQLVSDPEPLPDHLPLGFRRLVMSMLARYPADRPTAAECAAALEPLVLSVPMRPKLSRRRGLPVG